MTVYPVGTRQQDMTTTMKTLLATLLGTVLSGTVVQAQTMAETAAGWGLLGDWRNDACSLPLSPQSQSMKFLVKDNRLYLDRDMGAKTDSSEVTSVTIRPDGALVL